MRVNQRRRKVTEHLLNEISKDLVNIQTCIDALTEKNLSRYELFVMTAVQGMLANPQHSSDSYRALVSEAIRVADELDDRL